MRIMGYLLLACQVRSPACLTHQVKVGMTGTMFSKRAVFTFTKRQTVKIKFSDYRRLLDTIFVQGYFVYRL
jgi:hypothetical protein